MASLRRAALAITHRKLLAGWSTWRLCAEQLVYMELALKRLVPGAVREAMRAMAAWADRYDVVRSVTHQMALSERTYFRRKAHRAFGTWASAASAATSGRATHFRSMSRLLHRELCKAWQTWDAHALQMRRLRRIGASLRHRGHRACLTRWRFANYERAMRMQQLQVATQRIFRRETWSALNAWIATAVCRRQSAESRRRGICWWESAALRGAVSTWRDYLAIVMLAYAGRAWVATCFAKVWRRWSDITERTSTLFRLSLTSAMRLETPKRQFGHAWSMWKALVKQRCRAATESSFSSGLVRLKRELCTQRTLRTILHAWSRHTAEASVSGARRAFARQWKRSAAASFTRGGVMALLTPLQRSQWPKAWLDCFGWRGTWREMPPWLQLLGIHPVPASQADLLAVLRAGRVYGQLVRLASPSFHVAHRTDAHDPDDWRHLLLAFLATEHVAGILGSSVELSNSVRRGKAADHLAALTALRVVVEVNDADKWGHFVASLRGPSPTQHARIPRFTRRDPLDDYTQCKEGAECNYVCLGCSTPRILLQNLKCGKCNLHATTSTQEYMAMFEINRDTLFDRTH